MSRSVRLRPWQHAALARFSTSPHADFLAVATPGAGKTTFALAALRTALAERPAKVVIVAPTAHLKVQWAGAATNLGLHLDPAWTPADGGLPPDMHGVVTSYQQVAMSAPAIRPLARGAYVVLDEVHHAGDEQAWGESLREAFKDSARRLSLSGTPFRSDTRAIPFVRYEADEAVPDYEYGYGDALRDGRVVRPVYFPRMGGQMEWSAPDGNVYEASFEDPLATALANQRLRTALSPDGEWLHTVLRLAVDRLAEVRRAQPDAGGLVIAIDQDHARDIATLLRDRFRREAVVVTSDDPSASERIAAFAKGRDEWLVAVRMVSEGVDIPRLRVGVYATTTTTDLFFRQAVGRFVRWVPGVKDQRAWLYLPDDPRLRIRAAQIADQRRHSLRKDARGEGDEEAGTRPELPFDQGAEQLSMFEALSAVSTGEAGALSPWQEALPDDWESGADPGILVDLAPPPPVAAALALEFPGLTRRQIKDRLRDQNTAVARDIAYVTGLSHAAVNGELNRKVGVDRVTMATVEQLQERLAHGRRWLDKLRA
ncbi:MAG: DEAD/DEAH box helicase family protein [Chloroflexota bacterium]